MRNHAALELPIILERLSNLALSEHAKAKLLALKPFHSEAELNSAMAETTDAKAIIEAFGSPPLSPMKEIEKTILLCEKGAMLSPEQLTGVAEFLNTCNRTKLFLKKAELPSSGVAYYGESLMPLRELYEEIDESLRGGTVSDAASGELRSLRRKIEAADEAVKAKLESMLRSHREWFADSFVVVRNGRQALPVKKEYKNTVSGTVVDISGTGATVFIEPTQVRKLTDELSELRIHEENEVRRILYQLTASVADYRAELNQNVQCMQTLDFVFAKAKLSLSMKGIAPRISTDHEIRIIQGRHPLLEEKSCVPLGFEVGGPIRGVVITGPNTGGKTVAIKTVGLLSLMAQCGLHVPAQEGSVFSMHANVLCDIGDGQSISENLSTFSSHMTNIIAILKDTTHESLVLLDELGSGTDPAEGMGLAVAILEELRKKGCLFLTTSHYPEVKQYALSAPGLLNARMAFDKDSLCPLYRLEMGEAGESCALYIAQRLGLPEHILKKAQETAYSGDQNVRTTPDFTGFEESPVPMPKGSAIKRVKAPDEPRRCDRFQIGDSVRIYPQKDLGIVYQKADAKGMIGVQVKKQKSLVPHKRVQLIAPASELYPEDYDFSIVFETVEARKAAHQMGKHHMPGLVIERE